jgi:hypothetical protein
MGCTWSWADVWIYKLWRLSFSCWTVRISEQQLECVHVKQQIKALTYCLFQPDRLKRTLCCAETRSRESLAPAGAMNFTTHTKLQDAASHRTSLSHTLHFQSFRLWTEFLKTRTSENWFPTWKILSSVCDGLQFGKTLPTFWRNLLHLS